MKRFKFTAEFLNGYRVKFTVEAEDLRDALGGFNNAYAKCGRVVAMGVTWEDLPKEGS